MLVIESFAPPISGPPAIATLSISTDFPTLLKKSSRSNSTPDIATFSLWKYLLCDSFPRYVSVVTLKRKVPLSFLTFNWIFIYPSDISTLPLSVPTFFSFIR